MNLRAPRRLPLSLLPALLLLLGLLLLLEVLEEREPVGERLHLRHVRELPGDVGRGGVGSLDTNSALIKWMGDHWCKSSYQVFDLPGEQLWLLGLVVAFVELAPLQLLEKLLLVPLALPHHLQLLIRRY